MSASNFVRPLLRATLSFLLLLTAWSVQAAQVKFTSGSWPTGIALSGEGGSAALPGLTLQVMNTDTDGGTATGIIRYENDTFFATGDSTFGALTHDQPIAGRLAMVVKSANGRPFSLKSFVYLNWGENSGTLFEARGYRGGNPVSGATQGFDWPAYNAKVITLPAAFDNVDEVRIVMTSSDGVNPNRHTWHSINDLQVDIPNSAPTAIALSANTINQSAGANAVIGTLTSTDPDIGSSFTYALAAGTGSTHNASFNISGSSLRANNAASLAAGTYTVRVRTTDENGATFEQPFTLTVADDLAPSVSSIAVSGSPAATATSVAYLVTFSEAVINVASSDFTLTATGSAAGTVGTITGTGSNVLTVAVDSITGTGTLRLDLKAASGITDNAGNGNIAAYSSGAAHTVAIPTAPGAPTINTATPGNGQVSVAFTAPASDGGSAITGYTVTASPGGFTASGAASPLVVTGLANGTAYTFTVTATNATGTSTASAASAAVTPKAAQTITFGNPGTQNFGTAPTLTATSSSTLPVSFTSSTTAVCTITSGGALTFGSSGVCTINANQAGNGSFEAAPQVSQTFSVAAVVPGTPTIGTATAGDTQATVMFTAPVSTGGATITGYTVTANPGGATANGASAPITLTGLTNGIAYTFTVTATNSAGTGAASGASTPITPAAVQTLTFANPGAQNFGTTPTLTATSSAGLTPTFTSTTTAVCSITSGGTLTFISAGTTALTWKVWVTVEAAR